MNVFRPFDMSVLNLTKHHMAERFFSLCLKATDSNMTKPYRNLILFFQLTWFWMNCFGSNCALFKISKAEQNLLQCLERVWHQVTEPRRVKRLCSLPALGTQENVPHKWQWSWYTDIYYTILSEKAPATLVVIKKVGKQLVTTNGQCSTTTFVEGK